MSPVVLSQAVKGTDTRVPEVRVGLVMIPFTALGEEASYSSSRRKRSATSSACCANLKARVANTRLCSEPEVPFILCKRRRALSRR